MIRLCIYLLVAVTCCGAIGCSMCCGPYDFDYPAFGGKHERVNRSYGRVGSVFSDPNAMAYGPSADSNLKPAPEPLDPNNDSTDEDDEFDEDKFRKELDDVDSNSSEPEELPQPDEDPMAKRIWEQAPLRSQWR